MQVSAEKPLRSRVVRALYRAVMRMAAPFLTFKYRRRARLEPLYAHDLPARRGYYTGAAAGEYVWVHAVSLGETRACLPLIEAIRRRWPDSQLLLTHGTATGWAAGTPLLRAGDQQTWLPWDEPASVQRFLAHFKPRMGLLMETEVWPELVVACAERRLPLYLVNGRLSERSLHKASRFGLTTLSHLAFSALGGVVAQTADDAMRFEQLGARVLGHLGNVKFDVTVHEAAQAQGQQWRQGLTKPVVMLASSREGEEHAWVDALLSEATQMTLSLSACHWLLVPRHPHRVAEIERLLLGAGFDVQKRSAWAAAGPSDVSAMNGPSAKPCIWLGDSVGEMPVYYALADVALMGGSFAVFGGQNLIEAAACGCPVVVGPHTYNFAQAADWAIACGAAVRAPDMQEALMAGVAIADDVGLRAEMSQAALTLVATHQGASARTIDCVARAAEGNASDARTLGS